MIRSMKRLMAVVLMCFTFVSACGGGEESPGSETGGNGGDTVQVRFRLAFLPDGGLAGPFFYSHELGLYEEQGLQVEIEDGKGSALTAQDVANGDTDLGQVTCANVMEGIAEGLPIVNVGLEYGNSSFGILVPDESDIRAFSDLPGNSVATSPGSGETVLLPFVLQERGIDIANEVEVLAVAAEAKVSTYISGDVDAIGTDLPFVEPLVDVERPSRPIFFFDEGEGFPGICLVAHERTVREDPEMISSFLRATYAGMKASFEDPEAAAEATVSARPTLDAEIAKEQLIGYEDYRCTEAMSGHPHGYHAEEDWSRALSVLQEYSDLAGPIDDLSQFYTNEFLGDDSASSGGECP